MIHRPQKRVDLDLNSDGARRVLNKERNSLRYKAKTYSARGYTQAETPQVTRILKHYDAAHNRIGIEWLARPSAEPPSFAAMLHRASLAPGRRTSRSRVCVSNEPVFVALTRKLRP